MSVACVLVERDSGYHGNPEVLVVWHRKWRGWTLPGGWIEEGETSDLAAARELNEETGISRRFNGGDLVYAAPSCVEDRGMVYVYRAYVDRSIPLRAENHDSPVRWLPRNLFLSTTPFASFYHPMFNALNAMGTVTPRDEDEGDGDEV